MYAVCFGYTHWNELNLSLRIVFFEAKGKMLLEIERFLRVLRLHCHRHHYCHQVLQPTARLVYDVHFEIEYTFDYIFLLIQFFISLRRSLRRALLALYAAFYKQPNEPSAIARINSVNPEDRVVKLIKHFLSI